MPLHRGIVVLHCGNVRTFVDYMYTQAVQRPFTFGIAPYHYANCDHNPFRWRGEREE